MGQKEFRAIQGIEKGLGLYHSDIDKLGAKEDAWVKIEYNNHSAATQLRVVDREPGWPDDVAWVHPDEAKKLTGLPKLDVDTDPVKVQGYPKINVKTLLFPRSTTLYLVIFAAVFGGIAAVLGGVAQTDLAGNYKTAMGIAAIIFTVMATACSGLATLSQKQSSSP